MGGLGGNEKIILKPMNDLFKMEEHDKASKDFSVFRSVSWRSVAA